MPEVVERSGIKILIVEDEAVTAVDLRQQLEKLGYLVCGSAGSGREALDLAEKNNPDLVLMDIVLQGEMDGIEAAQAIRARNGVPIVFLSAFGDSKRLERAKSVAPSGYILKPFKMKDLTISIEMALYIHNIDQDRRKVENDLKKFKQIVSSATDGIAFLEHDYGCQISNDSFKLMFGLTDSGPEKQNFLERFDRDLKAKIKTQVDRCLLGESRNFQFWLPQGNTENKFLDATLFPALGNDGEVEGAVVHVRDMTAQKTIEAALKESEEKYRQLFSTAPSAIYEIDLRGDRLVDVNDLACEHLGFTREELLTMNPRELFGDAFKSFFEHSPEHSPEGVEPLTQLEGEMSQRNGRRIWVLMTALYRYENKTPVGVSVVVHDITKRKFLENLARKNEERFRLIANNTVDAAFFHDAELKYTWITKPFIPFTLEQILGHNDLDLLGEGYGREIYQFKKTVIEQKRGMTSEFTIPLPDGALSHYEITCSPRTSLQGIVVGLSGFMRNITARREAEEKVRLRESQLEEERRNLKEANTAFKMLLKHRDEEMIQQREEILKNIRKTVIPYFERLNRTNLDQAQKDLVAIIEQSLSSIFPGFDAEGLEALGDLTPKEFEVANLIKMGHSSKQISEILEISTQTVAFHRKNIRKKLGLNEKKQNLRTSLMKISR